MATLTTDTLVSAGEMMMKTMAKVGEILYRTVDLALAIVMAVILGVLMMTLAAVAVMGAVALEVVELVGRIIIPDKGTEPTPETLTKITEAKRTLPEEPKNR
jgi:hypothetical protein